MEIFEADSLEQLITSNDPKVWFCVIDAIFLGIDENLESVPCFQIQNESTIITFNMHRSEWFKFMDNAIQIYSDREEYEICRIIQQYQDYLTSLKNYN